MKKRVLRVVIGLVAVALWAAIIALVANFTSGWSWWSIGLVAVASVSLAVAAPILVVNSIRLWLYATSSPAVRRTLDRTEHLR